MYLSENIRIRFEMFYLVRARPYPPACPLSPALIFLNDFVRVKNTYLLYLRWRSSTSYRAMSPYVHSCGIVHTYLPIYVMSSPIWNISQKAIKMAVFYDATTTELLCTYHGGGATFGNIHTYHIHI